MSVQSPQARLIIHCTWSQSSPGSLCPELPGGAGAKPRERPWRCHIHPRRREETSGQVSPGAQIKQQLAPSCPVDLKARGASREHPWCHFCTSSAKSRPSSDSPSDLCQWASRWGRESDAQPGALDQWETLLAVSGTIPATSTG